MSARCFVLARLAAATALACVPLGAAAQPAPAQAPSEGYLCCNMRSDGAWISDINYVDGTATVPIGTPVKVTGFGRYRVLVVLDGGRRQAIGNDYSRDVSMPAFARRYVVTEDPRLKMAAFPARVVWAIEAGRLSLGMSREQVVMAIGYPITSENPSLDAPVWRYWRSADDEYQLRFDDDGRLEDVVASDAVRAAVLEP